MLSLVRSALLLIATLAAASSAVMATILLALHFEPDRAVGADLRGGLDRVTWILAIVAVVAFGLCRIPAIRSAGRPRTGRRGLAIACYGLFLFLLFEGVSRLAFSVPPIADRLWANESASWRRMWVSRHRSGAEFNFEFDRYDPLRGWIVKPNVHDALAFGTKRLNTNSVGMRGKREYPVERVAGKTRIVVLGDSFTFGEEVSDEDVYASRLQDALPNAEILNLGVHGYAHDQMAIHLVESGLRYRPDIVLLGFVQVDIDRNLLSFRDYAKPRFELEGDGDGLLLSHSPVPAPDEILRFDIVHPRILDLLAVVRYRVSFASSSLRDQEKEVTRRLLVRIAETTKRAGAKPVFVHLPVGFEIAAEGVAGRGEPLLLDFLKAHPDVLGFSARERFQNERRAGKITDTEGHWDGSGHRVAAQAIEEFLVENHLVER